MNFRILTLFGALSLLPSYQSYAAPMIELFTSQGCYSCPPADEHLAEIIGKQPEVVALEFHVDYWDDLNYGSAGVWKDPFSSSEYSKRQRQYNTYGLKGKRGVYTPQMVVNGHTAQVGTNKRAVQRALGVAEPSLVLSAEVTGQDVNINISGDSDAQALVWLAVFDRKQVTEVVNGENHGKSMHNHHVVRELTPIADWRNGGGSTAVNVPVLTDSNKGCAVFVQDRDNGAILGASYCKSAG